MTQAAMHESLLKFEAGTLDKKGAVELFEHLVKSGQIWFLPTEYLDNAGRLWESGVIGPKKLKGMHS